MFDQASPLADERLLEPDRLAELIGQFQAEAARRDVDCSAPVEGLDLLRRAGLFAAPLPRAFGGRGWGTESPGASNVLRVLRRIGQGNLALGRIYEGHVNAIALVMRYASHAQCERAAEDAAAGHLFAVWVTDGRAPVEFAADGCLRGSKRFCSAAPIATRALITARDGDQTRMLLVALEPGSRTLDDAADTHGMRGCATASVGFDGMAAGADTIIGEPGDYLRQPMFSAGAWRAAAVALGGLDALVETTIAQLRGRGRDADPHQAARIGGMLIARETASLWAARAAAIAESGAGAAEETVAYVNLARTAIEAAILDAMRLAQRSLGLAAFVRPNLAERLFRDLATYLRQPAPDEALTEAASWFAAQPALSDR